MSEAAKLWEAYQGEGDGAAREQLLEQNIRLVHHIARQVQRTMQAPCEIDDLVSAGTIGLMNAIDSFDPSRGFAFSTYAAPRIRGAILDDLRRWDHAPRSVRRKQRQIAQARESLKSSVTHEPNAREVADAMGVDLDTYWRWRADAEESVQVSLDRPIDPDADNTTTPLQVLSYEENIEDALGRAEEKEILRDAIMELKERERIVLGLYYYEELKLHEIARVLDLTESRVSQIRTKALATLREKLAPLREQTA